jgi:hypothetical protein
MQYNTRTGFSLIIGFLLILSLAVFPVAAVKVEGAKIMLDVKPGTNYIFPMAISTKPDDTPADYAIEVYGFGQSSDGGSYSPLFAADDAGACSARGMVVVESSLIHIDPGQRKAFNATIRVPANVGDGGRYAIIHIHPASAGNQQTGFATAIIVPVMLTVKDSKLIETGIITGVDVGEIVAGKPITVSTTLKNTGNHHYYGVVNQVAVTDPAGKSVATVIANALPNAVIPGQSVTFVAPVSKPLSVGVYTVKSTMMLESGTVLGTSSTSIAVKEAYIPPFTESGKKISPDNQATLMVPEGTITISFPQGAVLSDTMVTVKPYTGTLPVLPPGATAGTTAFAVDGLSGLLAKDATVTVKYTRMDLDAAKGDISKLVLGRYDRSENHWTFLPTTVDNNAMTLTATTNRFSTWAVIAEDKTQAAPQAAEGLTAKSPGPDALLVSGLTILVMMARKVKE